RIDVGFVVLPEDRFHTFMLMEDLMVALLPTAHPFPPQEQAALDLALHSPPTVRASFAFHGAQLLSWHAMGQAAVLYLTPTTPFTDGIALLGGVPAY
ncbi:hypothetical protein B1218_37855, partial [Pseudomonas ogarae]